MIRRSIHEAPAPVRAVARELLAIVHELRVTCWIAGGALRDAVAESERKDVDIWFPDASAYTSVAKRLYDAMEPWSNRRSPPWDAWRNAFRLSQNADVYNVRGFGAVDLVHARYFPTPDATIDAFDFTACCAALTPDAFVCHPDFERDAYARVLRLHRPHTQNTLARADRLISKGWRWAPGERDKLTALMPSLPQGNHSASSGAAMAPIPRSGWLTYQGERVARTVFFNGRREISFRVPASTPIDGYRIVWSDGIYTQHMLRRCFGGDTITVQAPVTRDGTT